MTVEIARIIGGMLSSTRMFSIGEDEVWLPFADDTFEVCRHLSRALTLHGYSAKPTRTRAYCGTSVDVDGAEPISNLELRGVLGETYGYKGRIPGLLNETLPYDAVPLEPGTILEIPHIGWTGDECRVVIRSYSGTYLAQINTESIENVAGNKEYRVMSGPDEGKDILLRELFENDRVIIKRREWTGYPQQTY